MSTMKKIGKVLGTLAVVTVAGFGTLALAQQGTTGTQGMPGMQQQRMGSGGQGWGPNWQKNMGNMSAEDMQKMQQLRGEFLKETEGLRRDLSNKDLELRNELAKQNPDNGKVAQLQKEISQMETRLYRIRDEYMTKMQKINPNMGRGMMRQGGGRDMMQPGSGQGMMRQGGGQGMMQPSN